MRIIEHFGSLQGEGLKIGQPTYFIRSAGCNLHCAWCDTGFSWDYNAGTEMDLDDIVALTEDYDDVCFTGGEPMEQPDASELLRKLIAKGKTVVLETNGSKFLGDVPKSDKIIISMDIKCPASGMSDRMCLENLPLLSSKDQLKFVISDRVDLDFAEKFVSEHEIKATIIFSPVGGLDLQTLAEEVVSKKLKVRVLPQLHKIIWGNRPGV